MTQSADPKVTPDPDTTPDIDTLAHRLAALLNARQQTLALAESCTGGGIGQALTAVPGSSAYFKGGVIAYCNQAKNQLLQVPEKLLRDHGAVSEPVAAQMARGAARAFAADLAIATTGIAGPGGGSPAKPVGSVCFGWQLGAKTQTQTCHFAGGRHAVRTQSVHHALAVLIAHLDPHAAHLTANNG
ncbi:MAG: CinA family protein [Cellvibrionales bacterium]|nr:CinA family protein [Cellvibrionales bacterium]